MKLKIVIPLLIITGLFPFCEKDDSEKSWVSIKSTQCANAWDNLGLGSVERNVTEYLKQNDIPVYDFRTEIWSYGPFCAACDCPSGTTILVFIKNSDIKAALSLGFGS